MTCIMDPVYQPRPQPMWGPQAQSIPALDMDYYIPHPPFTSPPATPMTPVTPHPHIFNPPHYEQAMPAPPPPPPNPFSPAPPQSYPALDFRLYGLCQQLLNYCQIPESHHKTFWDQFMLEYFTETATLTVAGDFGEGHRKYCLTRQWIQWYFKTMLENGVIGICLRLPRFITSFTQSGHQLDCCNAVMETDITMATHNIVKVCTTGSLLVEFSPEEKPRVVSWYFVIRDHQEFVPRNSLAGIVDDKALTMNITNHGLLPAVHALLLRAGGIMEATLQEPLPACSATPTTASLTSHWPDQLTVLSPQITVPLQPSSNLPPHSLPSCSVAAAAASIQQEKVCVKLAQQPSPLSSSGKKMKPPQHSPPSRSQFIMVAAEATTLLQAADDVPGLDERIIMRVDNTRPLTSGHSPGSHYNGSSDTSSETTPTGQPICLQDPSFLSATLAQMPSLTPSLSPTLSWTSSELALPTPGQAIASAK